MTREEQREYYPSLITEAAIICESSKEVTKLAKDTKMYITECFKENVECERTLIRIVFNAIDVGVTLPEIRKALKSASK